MSKLLENKAVLERYYEECLNKGNLDAIYEGPVTTTSATERPRTARRASSTSRSGCGSSARPSPIST
ncbi:hypothetical protein NKH18_14385 [Streptomyces sp. M10(2022)]